MSEPSDCSGIHSDIACQDTEQLNAIAVQAPMTIRDENGDELPPMRPCTPSSRTGGDSGKGCVKQGNRGKGVEKGAGKQEPTR